MFRSRKTRRRNLSRSPLRGLGVELMEGRLMLSGTWTDLTQRAPDTKEYTFQAAQFTLTIAQVSI